MPFTGKQARSGVQPDPACARQIDLAPGVKIGEINLGAAGTFQRFHVGFELNQVTRHKPGRQPQIAQHLHQQPAGIAAGARPHLQRLFRGLHAGLHANQVLDVLGQLLIQVDQEGVGTAFCNVNFVQVGLDQRGHWFGHEIGREFFLELWLIGKGKFLGRRLQKVVKRVVHRHLHHEINRDLEFFCFVGKHQPGLVIGKRVLLPVDEMPFRFNLQGIRNYFAAAVRRGSQSHHLRPQIDQAVVGVVRDMVESGLD